MALTLGLLAPLGCDVPPDATEQGDDGLTFSLSPIIGLAHYSVLSYWAPIDYQAADKKEDFVTAVDYDGNWRADDNWDHLDSGSMLGVAYAAAAESETHYFLHYSFYHPRDWTTVVDTEHENDFEGVTLFVRKDGTATGSLEGAVTMAHGGAAHYVTGVGVQVAGNGRVELENDQGVRRVRVYQEPEGHGMYMCGDPSARCGPRRGVRYVPRSAGAAPPDRLSGWTTVPYELRDMNELWSKRQGSGRDALGRAWVANQLWADPGRDAHTMLGNDSGGCGHTAQFDPPFIMPLDCYLPSPFPRPHCVRPSTIIQHFVCTPNAANAHWNDGAAKAPADYMRSKFIFPGGVRAPQAHELLKHDFGFCPDMTAPQAGGIDPAAACHKVCAEAIVRADASCRTNWSAGCVEKIQSVCNIEWVGSRRGGGQSVD